MLSSQESKPQEINDESKKITSEPADRPVAFEWRDGVVELAAWANALVISRAIAHGLLIVRKDPDEWTCEDRMKIDEFASLHLLPESARGSTYDRLVKLLQSDLF